MTEAYAMEVLFRDHYFALFSVHLGSLILGLPLAWNVLWHLKERFSNCKWSKYWYLVSFLSEILWVHRYFILIMSIVWTYIFHKITFAFQIASNARGRGVLRILLIQQQINLFCIPALCLQLIVLAYPSRNMPPLPCLILEIMFMIVASNHTVCDLAVALGRYNYKAF